MEIHEIVLGISGVLSTPAWITAAGVVFCRLLPLLSDRVNDRAVRLAKAKNKRRK